MTSLVLDSEGAIVVEPGPKHELFPGGATAGELYSPYLYFGGAGVRAHLVWGFAPSLSKLHRKSACCTRGLRHLQGESVCTKCQTVYAEPRQVRPFVSVNSGVLDPDSHKIMESWFTAAGADVLNAALLALDLQTLLNRQMDQLDYLHLMSTA